MNNDVEMADRYLIAIASYRRPEGLRRLLDSLHELEGPMRPDIVVVDNDIDESAREVAVGHPTEPLYVVEPQPGIAAARNRALDYFTDMYQAVIFVDDDEWVSPMWLDTLTRYADRANADVVQGPVVSVYPETTPQWIHRGGFFQRPILETGYLLPSAPTNNTLLSRDAWISAGLLKFDPAFSMTGGSDIDFFRGIRKAGAKIHYCAEAVVYEEVPVDRVSVQWLRRRAIRSGIVDTRVRLKHKDSVAAGLGRGMFRAARGALALAIGLVRGRGIQARPFNDLFNAYGRFAALFNYRIQEYARSISSS